jgi:ribosome biogenesis GTPase
MKVQPLVANIDYVFIITSLNNDFSLNRIMRYATMATAGGAIPVAVLTKADVCADAEALEAQAAALSESIKVVSVSAYTGFGMERLKAYIKPGATVALLGSSGAGKSTLVNTLAGREILRVGAIRDKDSKGRHTTTQRQLIELDGASFIDTPGLRELGMIDAGEGIADTFSDIAELIGQCAFSNCTHRTEPGCAIRHALENGTLSPERWELYAQLEKENRWSMDRKNEQMVSIALRRRELNRSRKKR